MIYHMDENSEKYLYEKGKRTGKIFLRSSHSISVPNGAFRVLHHYCQIPRRNIAPENLCHSQILHLHPFCTKETLHAEQDLHLLESRPFYYYFFKKNKVKLETWKLLGIIWSSSKKIIIVFKIV